ncbi:L,D-transpeptidase [Olivibacter sp. CPCC 100613]|uniref:L,D-transpeptidase n=1 Tax=Olivibacter sp. CPCC 100613 TaxID=3079931 RepID=UPI002FF9AD1F
MVKKIFHGVFTTLYIGLFIACSGNRQTNDQTDSNKPERKIPKIDLYSGKYNTFPVKGNDTALKSFKRRYTAQQQHIILALNRVDFNNFNKVDSLIIPDSVQTDINSYTPFPLALKDLDSVDKIVFFAYPIQAFAAYENGHLVHWGPSSMGSKIHPTKTGLSFTNWKAEEHVSTADDEWLLRWNFNIRNKEGIGWHQYTMPGYPASHSCLRLLENDAKWLYDWAEQWIVEKDMHVLAEGTPVIVFGTYNYEGEKPWFKLLKDPKANNIGEDQLTKEFKPQLKKILDEQENRKQVVASQRDSI